MGRLRRKRRKAHLFENNNTKEGAQQILDHHLQHRQTFSPAKSYTSHKNLNLGDARIVRKPRSLAYIGIYILRENASLGIVIIFAEASRVQKAVTLTEELLFRQDYIESRAFSDLY